MNNSTDGVTLYADFLISVLKNIDIQAKENHEIAAIVAKLDISDPFNTIPMDAYNTVCTLIEQNKGRDYIIEVGANVGNIAYDALVENSIVSEGDSPIEVIEGLIIAASSMIQDPLDRGWVILEHTGTSVLLRRTQTFNKTLQIGLLKSLLEKSNCSDIQIVFKNQVDAGAEFDEYYLTWKN